MTLLDVEAKKRGNSFYFPDRVIPMFPSEISNDICSLVPNKERKCIVVEVNFEKNKFKDFKIHRAIIISVARLTYDEVEEVYKKKNKKNKYFDLISNLYETYFMLKKNQKKEEKFFLVLKSLKLILYQAKILNLKKKLV